MKEEKTLEITVKGKNPSNGNEFNDTFNYDQVLMVGVNVDEEGNVKKTFKNIYGLPVILINLTALMLIKEMNEEVFNEFIEGENDFDDLKFNKGDVN